MVCVYRSFYMTISAPGGISSSAVDMAKWLMAHVNGSSALDPEIILQLYEMSLPIGGSPIFLRPRDPVTWTSAESYGMGYRRGYYRGKAAHIGVSRGGGQGVLTPPFPGPPLFICDLPSHPTRSHSRPTVLIHVV